MNRKDMTSVNSSVDPENRRLNQGMIQCIKLMLSPGCRDFCLRLLLPVSSFTFVVFVLWIGVSLLLMCFVSLLTCYLCHFLLCQICWPVSTVYPALPSVGLLFLFFFYHYIVPVCLSCLHFGPKHCCQWFWLSCHTVSTDNHAHRLFVWHTIIQLTSAK